MPKKPPPAPREHTLDLTMGVGLFRWGDKKATVLKTIPKSAWTLYEPMYLMQRVVYVDRFLEFLPRTFLSACIDPGDKDAKQVVKLFFSCFAKGRAAQETQWAALAELCTRMGAPPLRLPAEDVITWEVETTTVELSAYFKDPEFSLWIERPWDAAGRRPAPRDNTRAISP